MGAPKDDTQKITIKGQTAAQVHPWGLWVKEGYEVQIERGSTGVFVRIRETETTRAERIRQQEQIQIQQFEDEDEARIREEAAQGTWVPEGMANSRDHVKVARISASIESFAESVRGKAVRYESPQPQKGA